MRRAQWRVAWLVVPLLLLAAADAGVAHAHAVLLGSEPDAGAVLARPPAEILLHFNESVTPVFVRVLDASGRPVALPADAVAIDRTVHLRLPPTLADGSYVLSYRVISADSHPVGESLMFAIGPAETSFAAPQPAGATEAAWRIAAIFDRAILDAGFLIAVGGALFALVLRPGRAMPGAARAVVLAASCIAALAALSGIVIEGGLAIQPTFAALAQPAVWLAGFATTVPRSAALLVAGLAVLAAGSARRDAAPNALVVALGAALAAAGYVVSGHVAAAAPRLVSVPALFLHVLCVAFWVGSLPPLRRMLRREPGQAARVVARFGRIAVFTVALLALAGAAIAFIQLSRVADLVETAYGVRLAVKLALVTALVLVAATNRLAITPALLRGAPRAVPWLRRSIALELALMAAIVATTATLGEATPPRALAEQRQAMHRLADGATAPGYVVAIADPRMSAVLAIDPARPGHNRVRLDLADAEDAPLLARELTLSLENVALGIEPSERAIAVAGPGRYEIADLAIPLAGTWTFSIAALVGDFDRRIVTTEVPIR